MWAKIKNIDWDTDGENVKLPSEVELEHYELKGDYTQDDVDGISDELCEYLSDTYGFCVNNFTFEYGID